MKTVLINHLVTVALFGAALPAAATTILTIDSLTAASDQDVLTADGRVYFAAPSSGRIDSTRKPRPRNPAIEQAGLSSTYNGDRVVRFEIPFLSRREIKSASLDASEGILELQKISLRKVFKNVTTVGFTTPENREERRAAPSSGAFVLAFSTAAVPEPAGILLLGLAAALGAFRRKRHGAFPEFTAGADAANGMGAQTSR